MMDEDNRPLTDDDLNERAQEQLERDDPDFWKLPPGDPNAATGDRIAREVDAIRHQLGVSLDEGDGAAE